MCAKDVAARLGLEALAPPSPRDRVGLVWVAELSVSRNFADGVRDLPDRRVAWSGVWRGLIAD